MSETTDSDTDAADEDLKTKLETLKSGLAALVARDQASAPNTPATDPPTVRKGLETGAGQAVEKFRTTSRWILSAFAGVGVLVFGSLPFTDISDPGRDSVLILVGLSLAAVGISCAVWAVSRVNEPENASLGELKITLERVHNPPMGPIDRWIRFLPPHKAMKALAAELDGADGNNHVGPVYPGVTPGSNGIQRVSRLIESIGQAQKARYQRAARAAELEQILVEAQQQFDARTQELAVEWQRWVKVVELAKSNAKEDGDPTEGNKDG